METGAQDDDIDSMENMIIMLGEIENPFIILTFEIAVHMCLAMLLMLFVDKVYMAIVVGFVKVFGRKAEKRYKWRPLKEDDNNDDHELGNTYYPKLLVQIPMCNEKEVYKLSIRAACGLSWPSNRIIVQVLDDSTDPVITDLMKMECERWASKGINIKYEIRENRVDHKAGSLKAGMSHSYVKDCDFIAIFDADFQPEPDFLSKTVPYLLHNPQLALVQARWTFVNGDECLMTRMQEISMNYHFTVEQEVGSSTYAFFGFNGSAGVWRMAALNEAGGWNGRTTVEDMDLAVRASLKGWKFLYLDSVKVKNELPSTFKTYRNQQHRWSCGPANLFKKMVVEIVRNEKASMLKKLYLLYSFFFVRKIVAHMITFVFFCVVLPASTFVPEVEIPKWGVIYIPSVITLLNAIATPRSFHLVILSILFENVMSMHRTRATLSGLFEVGRVNEWVVTKKLGGASHKFKVATKTFKTFQFLMEQRFHLSELGMGAYLLFCGVYGVVCRENHFLVLYLFAQAMAFFIMGFGYVGTFVPS